jgi:CheY-like chemotaxis protein
MKDGTVLLVDDEPVVLQLHAAAVRHFGFEAMIAETAEEAASLVRAYRPALIISDIQMPGEGGFDFIEGLERSGLKNMPAIYLTGYDDIDIVRGGLRAGGDDFIIKGGPVEALRHRIAFWMASGFQELPTDVRRRALQSANLAKGDSFGGVEQHFAGASKLVQSVKKKISSELKNVAPTYGERMVERICFMGRLSNLVILESDAFGDLIRFPEHIDAVVRQLDVTWAKDMWPLFRRYEDWCCDPRFVLAGVEALKPFSDYDWFLEGI